MPSKLIRATRYDEGQRRLSVWFVPRGQRYDHEGVPPEVYDRLRLVFSKGSFFSTHIRNHYAYRLMDRAHED